jgi:hypothetical protein
LECKSGDFIAGRNEEVIYNLNDDLHKKLKKSICDVYLIGIEGDTKWTSGGVRNSKRLRLSTGSKKGRDSPCFSKTMLIKKLQAAVA